MLFLLSLSRGIQVSKLIYENQARAMKSYSFVYSSFIAFAEEDKNLWLKGYKNFLQIRSLNWISSYSWCNPEMDRCKQKATYDFPAVINIF